jgi:hypothetical protein
MGDQQEQEEKIAHQIREVVPGEWNEIRIEVRGNVGALGISPVADTSVQVGIPLEVSMELRKLRETMADPERGAWLTANVVIPRSGKATFSYDWMSKPDWGPVGGIDDVLYLDDLKKFPRTPENIPDWYPR